MNRISLLAGVAAFVLAALLSAGVAVLGALAIENRTIDAVAGAMAEEGLHWTEVSADGLQLFLAGTAPDEAAAFRAVTRAGAIVDADRVINRIEIAETDTATAPRFSLDMLRNGDGIQLIGLVPLSTGSDAVVEAISEITEGVDVTDMVEAADYPAPDTWQAALDYGLRALRTLPRSKISVYADRVEVEAISESPEQRSSFVAALERGQPNGIDVVLDISAPRPVVTPFTLRAVRDAEGTRFETCVADTTEASDRIVSAGRAIGMEGDVSCMVRLGVPSPRWADAVESALAALAELDSGSVTFTDADVTFVGSEGMAQDRFDRIYGELDANLPDVFSLRGVLPQAASETDAGPARFFATLDGDRGVEIRGRLPQGAIGRSVHAFAVATFGLDHTDIATRGVDDLPEGWAIRAMVGLGALAQLHDGELTLEPETLRLAGRTGESELISRLTRQLSEELGSGADFQLDVVYDEALDPIASLPSPEECVARIEAVQDDAKIVFDPGSVEINDEAGEILDRIAEILPDCQHVRMEIGGHTDSQGREEMNLNLSQSRADAVLNGLLARGVLVSNLTAQGYGESQPITANDTEEGRELNRRIEFRLLAVGTEEETGDPDAETAEAAGPSDAAGPDAPGTETPRPRQRPDSIVEAAAAAEEE